MIDESNLIIAMNMDYLKNSPYPFMKVLFEEDNLIYPYGVSSCGQGGFIDPDGKCYNPVWISYDTITGLIKPPVFEDNNTLFRLIFLT